MYGITFSYTGVCAALMIYLLTTNLGHEYIKFYFVGGGLSVLALLILIFVFKQWKLKGKSTLFSEDEM